MSRLGGLGTSFAITTYCLDKEYLLMKICIYIDSKGMGGIETHILQLIQGLLESTPFEIDLLFWKDYRVNTDSEHPLLKKMTSINPLIASRCRVKNVDGNIVSLFKYFQSNTLLVHTHGYKAGITARMIGLLTGTPIVSTYHNGDPGTGRLKLYNFIDKITSFLSLNIAVNESISHPLQRCSVISNFVNTINKERFFHELESRKEIAFVGRLSHEKGPDIFAEITKSLNHPISMYGDGEMSESLKQQFPHIEFKGMCDMEKNWKNIRVLVMTSRYEGLPLAALEAMARGIPVIASTAGALPKLIQDCKVGKSLAVENHSEFQNEIEKIMQQEINLYSKQGIQLIKFIDKYFSRKKNIPKIFNQYKIAVELKAIN